MYTLKRTWKLCNNSYINNIYDKAWDYISNEYDIYNQPDLYLNTSKSIHNLGLYVRDSSFKNSAVVLNVELINHPKEVLNTILHELCHHIADFSYSTNCHHDWRWKKIAQHVGNHYGEEITTFCSHNNEVLEACREKRHLTNKRETRKTFYIVKCESCDKEFKYKKKTWWINKLMNHEEVGCTCPRCKQHQFSVHQIGV